MSTFSDTAVRLDLLRERAFNLRWAEQPREVIPLTAADPDFPAAPAIRDAIVRYVHKACLPSVAAWRVTCATGGAHRSMHQA